MAGDFGDLISLDFGGDTGGAAFTPDTRGFSLGVSDFAPQALSLASEAAAPAADVGTGSGAGGWWSKFLSGLNDVGSVAKSVLPFASLGTGIMGAINQRDLMGQIAKQVPITQRAEETQIKSAEQGQALAPKAAEVAPEIKAVAPRFADLSQKVEAAAPKFADLATQVRTTVATPEVDFGRKLLAMADAGTLLDQDKAKLDDWERRQIADAEGYLARSGQGDSSARLDMLQSIRAKRAAMESQMIADYRTQALQYLQAGGGQLTSGAGGLTQQEIATLVESGQLSAEQAAVLGASVAPLTAAGSILAGSAGAAGGAAATSSAEEKTLEELIANLQAQLGFSSGRAA